MLKQQVLSCMFESWYSDFKNITFESETIALPANFLSYLLADGIVLPERIRPNDRSNLEGDSDDEVDWDSGNAAEAPAPNFPELDSAIQEAIQSLGGVVFPKLNWSSPKDASWISFDGTLQCKEPNDVYLLLKSSDFISHDLTEPFKHCKDCEASQTDGIQYKLTLRKWYNFHVGMEFRCFVKDNVLIGISQRHHRNHFQHIHQQKDEIIRKLVNFYEKKLYKKFADCNYVFDAYIDTKKVFLVDINPFGETTDPLLFSWEVLDSTNVEEANSEWPEFRFCKEDGMMQGNVYQQYAVPLDFVHLANGVDPNKFFDLLNMKIQSQNEDTSSDGSENVGG